MHIDMSVKMDAEMCTEDMRVDMCIDMRVDMRIDASVNMRLGVCVDLRIDMCIDMHIDLFDVDLDCRWYLSNGLHDGFDIGQPRQPCLLCIGMCTEMCISMSEDAWTCLAP